jgi:hypothetical protein
MATIAKLTEGGDVKKHRHKVAESYISKEGDSRTHTGRCIHTCNGIYVCPEMHINMNTEQIHVHNQIYKQEQEQ